jgi:hypothetical protein
MTHFKTIISLLIIIICFSCKNSNIDEDNSDASPIENNQQNTKSEPELVEDWNDSNKNSETNQDVSNENSSTPEYTDENIVSCSKCNTKLITPSNRACYYCNNNFSGWGFIKRDGEVNNEQSESIVDCIPELNIHNSLMWSTYEDACCSRRCAMEL